MNDIKGFTSPLWPIHFKPLPDELLSSWLVRLAHSHGLKVQTFCILLFGNTRQLWNRDIDRLAPDWLLQALSDRTGTPVEEIFQSTLRSYEGWFYPKMRTSSTLQWITALKLHHRQFEGYGIQFCPQCLRKDDEPYFRKQWRVAFNTICPQHNCMLHDRCQNCGAGVAFHRRDIGRKDFLEITSLAICHHCGFSLQNSNRKEINTHSQELRKWLQRLYATAGLSSTRAGIIDCKSFNVFRQFVMLITSRNKTVRLYEFICTALGISGADLQKGKLPFEAQSIEGRHHLIQLAGWLLIDLDSRLDLAWRAKALKYNHMIKDLEDPSSSYITLIKKFSNWRQRNG